MSNGEAWDHLGNTMIQGAIRFAGPGGVDAAHLQHIKEYIFQQQHWGTFTNGQTAYTYLQAGNTDQAASYLARAHAFIPDGSAATYTPGPNGTILAQPYDENTNKPLGQGTVINLQNLRGFLQQVADPKSFAEITDRERTTNNAIANSDVANQLAERKYQTELSTKQAERDQTAAIEEYKQNLLNARRMYQSGVTAHDAQQRISSGIDEANAKIQNAPSMSKNYKDVDKEIQTKFGTDPLTGQTAPLSTNEDGTNFAPQQTQLQSTYYGALRANDLTNSKTADNYAEGLTKVLKTPITLPDGTTSPTALTTRTVMGPNNLPYVSVVDGKGKSLTLIPASSLAHVGLPDIDAFVAQHPGPARGGIPQIPVQPMPTALPAVPPAPRVQFPQYQPPGPVPGTPGGPALRF